MTPAIFGLPAYALVHTVAALLFAVCLLGLFRASGLAGGRQVGWLLLGYMLATFGVAKVLYDLFAAANGHALWDHPSFDHFWEGGYWGWQLVFFPWVLVQPVVAGLSRPAFLRVVTLSLPGVISLQKLACLAAGCCSGSPTSSPLGIVFPEASRCPVPGVAVHPVQVYDLLLPLGILAALVVIDRRSPGGRAFLFPIFLGLYAACRFATEFLRYRKEPGWFASQWVELAAAAGIALLLTAGRPLWERYLEGGPPEPGGSSGSLR